MQCRAYAYLMMQIYWQTRRIYTNMAINPKTPPGPMVISDYLIVNSTLDDGDQPQTINLPFFNLTTYPSFCYAIDKVFP